MLFRYQITTAILFGPGSISNLGQEAEKLGHKALLVTYPDIRRVGLLDKVLNALKEKNIDVIVFAKVQCNPHTTTIDEGAALARAILSHLIERGITTFVATHYPELKTFAHSTDGVVNASLEFDVQTLRPTYHLTIGLPGRSNALAIAQRLGLDPQLFAAARIVTQVAKSRRVDWTIGKMSRSGL